MKEMIVTATFIGQNGSLGYKTGKEYKLRVKHKTGSEISITDTAKNPAQDCKYSNMLTFIQNWKNIQDITADVPKRDPKEIAINFLDFYTNGRSVAQLLKAKEFYKRPFDPRDVLRYFQNWSLTNTDKYRNGYVLTNNNTEGWKVKVWINDNSEYTFCSGTGGTDNPENPDNKGWLYFPKTMSEFISDCLRYEDVELLFNKKAIKEIYG